jgi:hypothetical protein
MWLGLVYVPSAAGDQVVVCAWTRDGGRPFTVGGPPADAPQIARCLREALGGLGWLAAPRCGECEAPLDLPPLP